MKGYKILISIILLVFLIVIGVSYYSFLNRITTSTCETDRSFLESLFTWNFVLLLIMLFVLYLIYIKRTEIKYAYVVGGVAGVITLLLLLNVFSSAKISTGCDTATLKPILLDIASRTSMLWWTYILGNILIGYILFSDKFVEYEGIIPKSLMQEIGNKDDRKDNYIEMSSGTNKIPSINRMNSSSMNSPRMAEMNSSSMNSSSMNSPRMAEMNSSSMNSPRMNSPRMNSPRMAEMNSSSMNSSSMNSPRMAEMNSSSMNSPSMNSSSMNSPSMNSSSMNSPRMAEMNSLPMRRMRTNFGNSSTS